MEGFPGNRFRYGFGLRPIATEHNDARVMVFHRQAPIVLGLFDLSNVLARLHTAERHILRIRKGMRLELLWLTGVNPHRCLILLHDVLHAFSLNLRDPPEGTPHWNAELVAPHVGISRREEFFRETFALVTQRTITVEHEGGRFVVLYHTTDCHDVRDIQRDREPGFRRYLDGSGNVAYGILFEWACVKDRRTLLRQDLAQFL